LIRDDAAAYKKTPTQSPLSIAVLFFAARSHDIKISLRLLISPPLDFRIAGWRRSTIIFFISTKLVLFIASSSHFRLWH